MATLLLGIALTVGLLILAAVLYRRWLAQRRRILWEDVLKQISSARNESRPTSLLEIGKRLGRSPGAMRRLAQELEAAGLVRLRADLLELTETGQQLGLQVLRGHRLWERYLSGDGQLSLGELHRAAERMEHRLTAEGVEALADHLGHPRTDPHGDVVPTAAGVFTSQQRTPLIAWPLDKPAVVVHVEDEPHESLKAVLRAGLRPGTVLRLVARDGEAIVCETPVGRRILTRNVAASIDVRPPTEGEDLARPMATLAGLPLGEKAEILGLSDSCTGLARRRLLDLGFTEGAPVKAVLANLEDEAHGYEIRGTMIALRREQAEQVLIKPIDAAFHRSMKQKAARP